MLTTRHGVRLLGAADLDAFLALAGQDPVVNVFADYRARTTNLEPRWLGGEMWGRFDDGRAGRGLPRRGQPGAGAGHRRRRPRLRRAGADPRPHASPPSSARRTPSRRSGTASPPAGARRARPAGTSRTSRSRPARRSRPTPRCGARPRKDIDELYPACVAMYTEEVGVSPECGGGGDLYRARVTQLITRGLVVRPVRGRPAGLQGRGRLRLAARRPGPGRLGRRPTAGARGSAAAGMAAVVELRPPRRRAGRVALRQRLEPRRPAGPTRGSASGRRPRFATIMF